MSLRFGSGWLVIYFLICSCTLMFCSPVARNEIIRRLILLPLQGRVALTVEVTRPRGYQAPVNGVTFHAGTGTNFSDLRTNRDLTNI